MSNWTRTALAGMCSAAITFGLGQIYLAASESSACLEDQQCWDCSSMGNKICGEDN